jgi:hypothetical protein
MRIFAEYISVERFSEDDFHPDGRGGGRVGVKLRGRR